MWGVKMSVNTNNYTKQNIDILLTHSPYEWCKRHSRMELLMSCENALVMIKKEIEKLEC